MKLIKLSHKTVFVLSFIVVVTFVILGYSVYTLHEQNMILHDKEIATEYKMLNIVRTSEVSKSMVNIELLKCKGVKQSTLDSMSIKLFITNNQLIRRDSTFITERYREIHGE